MPPKEQIKIPRAVAYTVKYNAGQMSIAELVWIDRPNFLGWGCSQCEWIFHPTDPPTGETLDAMAHNFVTLRDKEFATHVCAKYPQIKRHA
jgi:rubredoxin